MERYDCIMERLECRKDVVQNGVQNREQNGVQNGGCCGGCGEGRGWQWCRMER